MILEYPTYGYHHTAQPAYPMYPTYPTSAYNQVQQGNPIIIETCNARINFFSNHFSTVTDYTSPALYRNFYSQHHPHHQTYNPYDIYHHPQPGKH